MSGARSLLGDGRPEPVGRFVSFYAGRARTVPSAPTIRHALGDPNAWHHHKPRLGDSDEWYLYRLKRRGDADKVPPQPEEAKMTDLVRQSDILKYTKFGEVTSDLAVEDLEKERERWASSSDPRHHQVAIALDAVKENRQLVDINLVISRSRSVTTHDGNLPKVAIAPYGAKEVTATVDRLADSLRYSTRRRAFRRRWSSTFPWAMNPGAPKWEQGIATMPLVPPDVAKVSTKSDLVLWEADWHSRSQAREIDWSRVVMAIDPAILEPVIGSLYVVKATWDLSPLEAAALR